MELEKSMSVISTVYVNTGQWSEWPPGHLPYLIQIMVNLVRSCHFCHLSFIT